MRSFTQDTLRQNGLSPEMIEKIQRRDQELREEYYALHGHFDDVTDPATGKITYVYSSLNYSVIPLERLS